MPNKHSSTKWIYNSSLSSHLERWSQKYFCVNLKWNIANKEEEAKTCLFFEGFFWHLLWNMRELFQLLLLSGLYQVQMGLLRTLAQKCLYYPTHSTWSGQRKTRLFQRFYSFVEEDQLVDGYFDSRTCKITLVMWILSDNKPEFNSVFSFLKIYY